LNGNKIDINEQDNQGKTALIHAASDGTQIGFEGWYFTSKRHSFARSAHKYDPCTWPIKSCASNTVFPPYWLKPKAPLLIRQFIQCTFLITQH